jgi:acyl-CoA thioester hydrolase
VEKVASFRVIYGDTDAMGIVYYANYLRWFEAGRVELLRSRGYAYREVTGAELHLPVVESHANYRASARYDDVLDVYAEIVELRGARLTFAYRILRSGDDRLLVEGHTTHAFVDSSGRPVRPNERMRAMFAPSGGHAEQQGVERGSQPSA